LVQDLVKAVVSGGAASRSATKQAGSAALVITKQLQLNLSALTTLAQAASLSTVPSPTVTVGPQAGLAPVSLLRASAPFLPAPDRPVETRIESGGGDNPVLQDDDQADQEVACVSSMFGQDNPVGPALSVAADSASEAQSAAGLRQVCDAYFADWTAESKTRGSEIASSSGTLILDPAAGQSCLAVIFGCYWSAHFKESERRVSRGRMPAAAGN
jgi:hypothetical protein